MKNKKQQLKGWRKVRLKDIGKVVTGKTPPTNQKKFYNGVYPFITPSDLESFQNWYIENTERNLSEDWRENNEKYLLPPNSINYVCIGSTVGKISLTKRESFSNQQINSLVCNEEEVDPCYCYYRLIFQTDEIQAIANARGSGKSIINKTDFENYEIELPLLPTQQKIASVLSAYDELIENNTKRIKVLEELAQAVYNEWFVKFHFPGYKKIKMIDSGIEFGNLPAGKAGIPEGWEVRNILDVGYFKFCKSKVKEFEGKKEYLATANIDGINIVKAGEMVEFNSKPSRAQIQPKLNTVWFARMKDTYKIVAYRKINQDMCNRQILSSGMVGFESEEKYFGFMYYTINSDWFHKLKDQHASGSTQISLTNTGLAKINILVPSKELVVKYSKITNKLIDKIILLQKINQNLRQTRDLLLPKLVSGEVGLK